MANIRFEIKSYTDNHSKLCGTSNNLQFAIWSAGIVARNLPNTKIVVIDTSLPHDSEVEKTVYIVGKGRVNYKQAMERQQAYLNSQTLASLQKMAVEYGYKKNVFKVRKKTLINFLLQEYMNKYMQV